jgi:type IV pilus assembly protein PilO
MASPYEKLANAPASTKGAALVMILALVGAGWYSLYYSEVVEKVEREASRTPSLNDKLREQKKIEKNLVKFQDEINKLRQARDRMRDRLPEQPAIAGLLQQIHSQAKVVGLDVNRFERGENENRQLYARIPVRMTLNGTFHQVATFFFYLGRLTRIVNIEDIELVTLNKREEGDNRIAAVCSATTFMYLAPEDSPKGSK